MNSGRGMNWLLGLIALLLCQPSLAIGARIVPVTMGEKPTEGGQALEVKSRFSSDAPEIHLLVRYDQHEAGSKLKCVWISVDAIQIPNYEIDSVEVSLPKAKSGSAHFSLSKPANGWPPGAYRCDLFFDRVLRMSVPFQIVAAPTPASGAGQSSASGAPPPMATSSQTLSAAVPTPFHLDLGPVKKAPQRA